MPITNQGALTPPRVETTRGFRDDGKRQCGRCGLYKGDNMFAMDANGTFVCPDCANGRDAVVLRQAEVPVDGTPTG